LVDPYLAGVSLEAVASFGKQSFREALLFTHRGLSGPAILQISSYWKSGGALTLNLLPDLDVAAFLIERKTSRPKAQAQTILAEILPARLAEVFAQLFMPPGELANVPDRVLATAAVLLQSWSFKPGGTEGYAKAEVTLGGIDTRDLSSKTMGAINVPGLYAIGEAVDVTGWLGGYNFQWAWSSGYAAGMAV
jgi:predicted Rossmann fold flavoprotein